MYRIKRYNHVDLVGTAVFCACLVVFVARLKKFTAKMATDDSLFNINFVKAIENCPCIWNVLPGKLFVGNDGISFFSGRTCNKVLPYAVTDKAFLAHSKSVSGLSVNCSFVASWAIHKFYAFFKIRED